MGREVDSRQVGKVDRSGGGLGRKVEKGCIGRWVLK